MRKSAIYIREMRKKSYLYIVVSISVLNSCLKDKVPNEFAACSDLVSFSQDIQPLVELNCLGCHNEVVAANDVILTNHLRIAN